MLPSPGSEDAARPTRLISTVPLDNPFRLTSGLMLVIALAISSVTKTPILADTFAENQNPHHFQQRCETCHEPADNIAMFEDQIPRPNNSSQPVGALHLSINQACSRCHDHSALPSHPVGVRASRQVPPDMPLNRYSQITCLTCHEEPQRSAMTAKNPYYLRRPPGREFCASCHQNSGGSLKERAHWQFTTKAHLGPKKQPLSSWGDMRKSTSAIDSESRSCLSCHDDMATIVVNTISTRGQRGQRFASMSNHPIGMDYEENVFRNGSEFRSASLMDSRIRFFDGRVGCGTCHNLYNHRSKNLSIRNTGSALCLSCHNKL